MGQGRITGPGMGEAAEKGQCLLPLRLHYFPRIGRSHLVCESEHAGLIGLFEKQPFSGY